MMITNSITFAFMFYLCVSMLRQHLLHVFDVHWVYNLFLWTYSLLMLLRSPDHTHVGTVAFFDVRRLLMVLPPHFHRNLSIWHWVKGCPFTCVHRKVWLFIGIFGDSIFQITILVDSTSTTRKFKAHAITTPVSLVSLEISQSKIVLPSGFNGIALKKW